jgi:hypothetical protein
MNGHVSMFQQSDNFCVQPLVTEVKEDEKEDSVKNTESFPKQIFHEDNVGRHYLKWFIKVSDALNHVISADIACR